MGIQVRNKARFAIEGFRLRRANSDGTVPTPYRLIGGIGPFTHVLGDVLSIKLNANAWVDVAMPALAPVNIPTITVDVADVLTALIAAAATGNPKTVLEGLTAEDFDADIFAENLKISGAVFDTDHVTVMAGSVLVALREASIEEATKRTISEQILKFARTTFGNLGTIELVATGETPITPSSPYEVPDLVAILNSIAAFGSAGFVAYQDTRTKRLAFAYINNNGSNYTEVQIKILKDEAQQYGFGYADKYGGYGTYWKSYFNDETVSCTLPNDLIDREDIDLEGGKGTVTRMIIPAKRLGASPVVSMKFKVDELSQIIQGGNWVKGVSGQPDIYDPPSTNQDGAPMFTFEVFAPLYGDGASQMDQVIGYTRNMYYACTGTEGDVPMEAKSWATFSYNIISSTYTDEYGKVWPSERRFEYDLASWDYLNVEGVGEEEPLPAV